MIFPFRKRGKRQFQKLTDPHVQLLYNMALRYCANRFDAEDILQKTMYIAFKNWNQLKEESKCKAWLLTILRRLYLKEIKQNAKQAFTVEDIDTLALKKDHIAVGHIHAFEENETPQTVRTCLAELPENTRHPYYSIIWMTWDIMKLQKHWIFPLEQ